MASQSIIKTELFKSLVEIEVNDYCIDLHNDYDCTQLNYSGSNNELLLSFRCIRDNSKYPSVILQFDQVELKKMNIDLQVNAQCRTIDNLYRCRFALGETLIEHSPGGQSFYALEFCEGHSLEFFAGNLLLVVE